MMGHVALPDGARVSTTSGGDNRGHCIFDVDGDPARTYATMVENLFRATTVVQKRELSGEGITRRTAEGWDEGWWRVDVVSAASLASRVTLTRWSPRREGRWMSPNDDDLLSPFLDCDESCRHVPSPGEKPSAGERSDYKDAIDRCMFACEHKRGRHPPAMIEKIR